MSVQAILGAVLALSVPCASLGQGVFSYWKFNENTGSATADALNAASSATVDTGQWRANGIAGSSLNFDGLLDRVDLPAIDVPANQFTIAVWIRPESFSTDEARLVSKATGTSESNHLWMLSTVEQGGFYYLRARVKTDGTTQTLIADGEPLSADTWTHAAMVYDGSILSVYKDGVIVGSLPLTGSVAQDPSIAVGVGNQPTGAGDRPFHGLIDELKFYDGALATTAIQDLANPCSGQPESIISLQRSALSTGELIDFSGTDSTDCDGSLVSFDWDFGDGSSAQGVTVGHAYSSAGQYSATLTVTDDTGNVASASVDVEVFDPSQRVSDRAVASYRFEEGQGATVNDTSFAANHLTISDATATQWLSCGGLRLNAPTVISNGSSASALIAAVKASNELTVEGWVVPANVMQTGPARIAGVSGGTSARNFTLAQDGDSYNVRLRTTGTGDNGLNPSTSSPPGAVAAGPTHVAYTRNASGEARLYIDGVLVSTENVPSSTSNWEESFGFLIGNEVGEQRPWLGDLYLVEVQDRALTALEVAHNYQAGYIGSCNRPPEAQATADVDHGVAPLSVQFDASGSTDPDGDPLSYSWQLTDSATATGIATSFVFTEPGEYPVLLTATDAGGESDSQTVWIRVFDPNQEPRVSDDLLAYYAFDQTEGGLILDRSNDPVRLDLAIDNPANSQWRACGGLELQSPSLISSLIPADGVAAAVRSGGELTLEAWITPADNQQDGPARILSLSADTQNRNATLGQDGDAYTVRFRTSETGPNGLAPSLSSNPGTLVAGQPNHVLYTRDSSGLASVYVNGVLSGTETVTGDTSNWSDGYPLLLGNEATGNRPWLGTYHIAAIYDRALSSQEAQQNFLAGFSSPCPAPPSAVIEATPVVGNAPLSVSFNGSASSDFGGYLVSYAWDFGDGTQGTGAQVSHLYDMAGNYTVTLTVTDNEGLANTAYRTIRVVTPGANFRVADGLIAEYDFLEGQGTSVLDISGVGLPLDLTIEDPGYVEWLTCGGLGVRQETLIRSAGPASKLTDRILSTGALTLEAWVRPDNLTQGPSSPARIATLSESASRRNVTLGQKASGYEARLRTTETSLNGTNPSTGTATNVAMETLTHVVYTRDASGNSTIYVDGSENVTGLVGGDFSNWDPHYAFAVANELDRERGFLGDLHLVAVYERALSTVEVNQNFQAGFVDLCANTNAPTAVDQSVVTDEDQNVPVVLSANDPDGDSLTYTVLAAPTRGALAGTPPALTYIPEQNFNGTDSLTFVASDGSNTSNVATVTLTVNPVNDPPMANSDAVSLNEDATANITLVASDLDGDALSYEILSQPGSGTLTGSGPIFVYTPAANFFGTDSFSYLVSDGTANSSAETVSLSVISVNDIPIAIGASAVVDEDSSVVVSVSASDVESPSLNYVVSTPPSHGVVSGNGPDFSYTPNPGFSGSDSFSFVANDGLSDSVPALVSIVVNAVNDPPVAVDIAQTLNEDEPVSVVLSASDEDGDALTFALTSQPQHGELTGTSPNLTYTPDPDFNGVDSFTYQAFDGTVSSMGATVTLTVTAVNDLPLAQDDLINLAEDTTAMVRLTASDADGDLLTFAIVDAPANGTLVGGGSDYDYTPGAGFSGTDSLTFVANDGAADSNLATITLVVEPINDPPTADDLSISTNEDVAVALTLAGTDPDGDAITLAITQAPLRGTLSGTPPNLTYLPNADENGEDTFRFTVSDGIAESDPATVTVQILAQNDAPVADPQSLVVTEASLALTLTGSDVDGDPLTYQVVVSPAGGTLSGTAPNLTYTRNSGFSGPDSFTFQVSDGQADSAAAVVNLDVQVNNAAPEITSTPVLDAAEGAAYAYDVDASDADGDSLTYSLVIAPQGMSIDSATGLISWVPLSDTLGAVDVRVRASDPQGAFAEQDYVVTVPGSTINRSYLGTDFWLTFLRNDIDPGAPAVPALSIAAPGGASGTISVASLAIDIPFTIPAGGLERIELPISVVTRTNGTPDPVGVNVSADAPITVMAFNERTASTDAAQVYPTNVLASDYTIPAFHSLQLGAFGIVATEDNTLVTVTPGPGVTQMIGNGTFNQAPFNITLQQGDVWTNTPGSRARFVTGTTLRSSRPIGVFAGAICANVPNEETISCDHMIEQVPGDDQLATRFLSVPFATRFNGDLFRFVATTDDTVVRVNGVESAYLDALEFVDRVIDGVAEITSTAPIHAAQIATGQAFDAVERGATEPGNSDADPFMVLLPPTTAYLDEYIFTTAGTDRLNSHYVNVIIPDTAAASLVLDGQPADISTLVPIEDTGYLGGAIEVSYGTHTMSAAEKFGVTIYGWGPAESYGTNGNAILGDLPPVNRLEVTPLNQTQTVGANACFTITTKNGLDYAVPFARIDVRVSGARTIRQSIATNDTGTANYCYIGIDAGTETATFISGPAIESANVTWEALSADTQAAPIIISLPPLELNEATHAYTIDAFDPNGDAITYGLVAGPAGVTVDGASGTLSWTPTVPQDRVSTLHAISVSATDPFGNQGVQNYELLVNYAPVFSEITPEESESFAPTFTVRAIGGNVDTNQLAIIEAPPRATVTNSGPDNQWLLQSGLNNTVGGEINLVREALEVFNPYCRAPLTDRSALNVKSVWTSTEDLKLVQVAPLTDTDGNGVINTADDQAIIGIGPDLTALDATTGTFLWRVSGAATIDVGAAIADIDGDNVPEVLVANDAATGERHLYGYSNLGDLLWESVTPVLPGNFDETRTAIEVFDLDGDGAVEIVVGPSVLDGTGNLLWQFNTAVSSPVVEALPWIADLEGDGQYEVLFGSEIRNADGSLRWSINGAVGGTNPIAQFVASDLDQDG
ncbi:MAG: Ig-like domain-containing protein, partial [Pseudomonadota bacterium]